MTDVDVDASGAPGGGDDDELLMDGVLLHWTNYLSGWQPRLVEVANTPGGTVLRYYLDADSKEDGRVRGSIDVLQATVYKHKTHALRFDVAANDRKKGCFHFEAGTTELREEWVACLLHRQAQHHALTCVDTSALPLPAEDLNAAASMEPRSSGTAGGDGSSSDSDDEWMVVPEMQALVGAANPQAVRYTAGVQGHAASNTFAITCTEYSTATSEILRSWTGSFSAERLRSLHQQLQQLHPEVAGRLPAALEKSAKNFLWQLARPIAGRGSMAQLQQQLADYMVDLVLTCGPQLVFDIFFNDHLDLDSRLLSLSDHNRFQSEDRVEKAIERLLKHWAARDTQKHLDNIAAIYDEEDQLLQALNDAEESHLQLQKAPFEAERDIAEEQLRTLGRVDLGMSILAEHPDEEQRMWAGVSDTNQRYMFMLESEYWQTLCRRAQADVTRTAGELAKVDDGDRPRVVERHDAAKMALQTYRQRFNSVELKRLKMEQKHLGTTLEALHQQLYAALAPNERTDPDTIQRQLSGLDEVEGDLDHVLRQIESLRRTRLKEDLAQAERHKIDYKKSAKFRLKAEEKIVEIRAKTSRLNAICADEKAKMQQRREERASRVKSYFEHISATLRKQSMDRKRQEEMRKSASSRKEAAARIKAAKEAEAGAGSDTASSPDKAAAKEAQKRAVERIKQHKEVANLPPPEDMEEAAAARKREAASSRKQALSRIREYIDKDKSAAAAASATQETREQRLRRTAREREGMLKARREALERIQVFRDKDIERQANASVAQHKKTKAEKEALAQRAEAEMQRRTELQRVSVANQYAHKGGAVESSVEPGTLARTLASKVEGEQLALEQEEKARRAGLSLLSLEHQYAHKPEAKPEVYVKPSALPLPTGAFPSKEEATSAVAPGASPHRVLSREVQASAAAEAKRAAAELEAQIAREQAEAEAARARVQAREAELQARRAQEKEKEKEKEEEEAVTERPAQPAQPVPAASAPATPVASSTPNPPPASASAAAASSTPPSSSSSSPPPPPPPPPPPMAVASTDPTAAAMMPPMDDARGSLMSAIRRAGGTNSLRPATAALESSFGDDVSQGDTTSLGEVEGSRDLGNALQQTIGRIRAAVGDDADEEEEVWEDEDDDMY